MSELQQLASGIDLREIVKRFWGQGKTQSDGSVRYKARWKNGDNPTRFAVYEHHYYDYKDGDHGDVYDFLCNELKIDFKRAVEEVRRIAGGQYTSVRKDYEIVQSRNTFRAPPDETWQKVLLREVRRLSDYLLIMPETKPVRDYLRDVRGISEDQQYYDRLGYNATWRRLDLRIGDRQVWMPPGIIIPRYEYGILFGVRVRLMTGKVAQYTGIENVELRHQKYSSVTGSKHTLAVAGESTLRPGATVLFCEGEFDRAVLLDQLHGMGRITILTMGSASQKLPDRLIPRLRCASSIYFCLDNDDAGRKASERLVAQIKNSRCFALPFPDGSKDACDYYERQGGAALREWWENRSSYRQRLILE